MSATKHHVTIKGNKDGLVFILDDTCEFADLLEELQYKLEKTHQTILTGPIIHIRVKLGKRIVTEEQKEEIRKMISTRGNLIVQSIESDDRLEEGNDKTADPMKVLKGIVRSGQTIIHDGNLLYIGDVNPGGMIACTGDIFIMGSLRGMAHAGTNGNKQSVIAASHLRPTQLRIANVVSRPPDEWGIEQESFMEFAYLREGQMQIDKIAHLHRIRPGASELKGE